MVEPTETIGVKIEEGSEKMNISNRFMNKNGEKNAAKRDSKLYRSYSVK